ncbi:GNAT family N-acetyltransferase [Hyalangium gracile]|uniref:GNAT family N-acetyltransferase n=1 Tax=Hyalangium gracile TaxID=394092 RepID=UPI001CCDB56B|nr:GNAT family N-acetyltransferase [Hyalangium gracile]
MVTTHLRAILSPDEGKLALSTDYFRSEHHLRAEGVTHTLIIDGGPEGALFLPLIVRPIPGTPYRDAVSPYGYPGGVMDRLREVPKHAVDWKGTELVSIFVRDRIMGPRCFAEGTERNEVFFIDSRRPITFRETHRRHLRRNFRLGFVNTCRPVLEASLEERECFKELYRQTMVRDEASSRYFFSDAYFESLLCSPAAWLAMTRAPEGHIASAAIGVASDGVLHYYLGGTANADLARSPAKNVFVALTELSSQLGLPLNLGGGIQPGDGLEDFKRGFSNASFRLRTHEIICEPAVYSRLAETHTADNYFPAYRVPRR